MDLKMFIQKVLLLALLLINFHNVSSVLGAEHEDDILALQSQNTVDVEVDGTVSKQIVDENIMYLGGDFTQIKMSGSSAISRQNFVTINTTQGSITAWNPQFNGKVEDIEVYEDRLYVSGQFTKVDGKERNNLAIFNKNTQKLLDINLNIDGPVYAIERYQSTLFLGGSFTKINGIERGNLASISLVDHTLNQWSPAASDTVYSMVIHNNLLYIGGAFNQINGLNRNKVGAFILPSGDLSLWESGVNSTVRNIDVRDQNLVVYTENPTISDDKLGEITLPLDTSNNSANPLVINVTTQPQVVAVDLAEEATVAGLMVDTDALGFQIPSLGDLLTFSIRIFFVIAGLAALFYMLIGAFSWVTSGGDKDAVTAAREKIQAAVVGLIMMVVVLAIVWTLEQVIFKRRICLGISCPLTLPSLLEPTVP